MMLNRNEHVIYPFLYASDNLRGGYMTTYPKHLDFIISYNCCLCYAYEPYYSPVSNILCPSTRESLSHLPQTPFDIKAPPNETNRLLSIGLGHGHTFATACINLYDWVHVLVDKPYCSIAYARIPCK